jgi:hypothetical protein
MYISLLKSNQTMMYVFLLRESELAITLSYNP